MVRIAALLFLVNLALIIGAIADCLGGEREPRHLPRALWVVVILFVPIIGGAAWFWLGRPRRQQTGRDPKRPKPVAPDDDPEFLRDLERRLREDNDGH